MTLKDMQRFVRGVVPAGLIGPDGGWIGYRELVAHRKRRFSSGSLIERPSERHWKILLRKAQELLRHFAENPRCRGGRPRWNNPGFCPEAPYGNYQWDFTACMVHHLLVLDTPFRRGVRFGRQPAEPFRDANPYQSGQREKRDAWDRGYILGLAWEKAIQFVQKRLGKVKGGT